MENTTRTNPSPIPSNIHPETAPEQTTPGDGERIAPVEARAGRKVGLWKVLSISLVLAIAGIALIAAFSS